MLSVFLNTGLMLLGTAVDKIVKGAGLAYLAKLLIGKIQVLANLFTDDNKDNAAQLRSFAKTQVAQLPTELATGIIEHTAHNLTEAEEVELLEISKRFGELYAKAWK
jgi:hypothetical protein